MTGKPTKCDGNHGGPRCADPECWNDSPPTDVASPVLPKVAEILAKIEAGKYVSQAEIQMASMVEADRLGISAAEWEERYRPNRCAGPHCRDPKCNLCAPAMHAPAPKLPEGTEQVSSAWLAQLRQEYREYGQQADDLREQNKALQATIDQLRQHKTDYMEAAEETAKALRAEIQELRDRPTLAYGISGNRYMVATTREELPDVYEDAQVIELVRGRPYTRQEPQA